MLFPAIETTAGEKRNEAPTIGITARPSSMASRPARRGASMRPETDTSPRNRPSTLAMSSGRKALATDRGNDGNRTVKSSGSADKVSVS